MKKYLKKILIPMIIITIITSIVMLLNTIKQYKSFNEQINIKMSQIISEIKENYPEVDTNEIIEILNKDDANNIEGKELLKRYGMYSNEENSILTIKNQMNSNIKTNVAFVVIINLLWIIIAILYIKSRNKKLNEIKKYINEINNRNYELKIEDNSEDELSNLKNELYKITVMLKEEAEKSKQDKESLKVSVQDISHQLKTPITSISIMLDNLKDNPKMDEKTRQRFIFEIDKQIENISFLIISLLKFSRLEAGVEDFIKEKINVKELISACLKRLEIPIEIKNQNIVIKGKEDSFFIGDYKWQEEAITNIIKNCIEHTDENKNIYINYEENNLYTKIQIIDEGNGIDKEDIKHIFERFYKGKDSSENSIGIGLALAKTIIEKDNGYISCKSEKGKGTEFIIKYMK